MACTQDCNQGRNCTCMPDIDDTPSIALVHTQRAIRQAKDSGAQHRYRVEHRDGNVSYVYPMAKPVPIPEPVRLSPAAELRCAFLRWKAGIARAEIAKARAHGIYVTDTLTEYERQIDSYEQQIAQITARAAANPRKPPSLFREVIVGLWLICLIVLAFNLWSK